MFLKFEILFEMFENVDNKFITQCVNRKKCNKTIFCFEKRPQRQEGAKKIQKTQLLNCANGSKPVHED